MIDMNMNLHLSGAEVLDLGPAAAEFFADLVALGMVPGGTHVSQRGLRVEEKDRNPVFIRFVRTAEGKTALAIEIPCFAAGWPPTYRRFGVQARMWGLDAETREQILLRAKEVVRAQA